jgi:GNAT superfamily N-acetyltransferase
MDNLGHLGAPSGVIEDVVVDPALHRAGIGRAMIEFAIAHCREKGCYKAALSANMKRDEAHAFYESLGFQRHGYSFLMELQKGGHQSDGVTAGLVPHNTGHGAAGG